MANFESIKPYVWHCPNCGTKVSGFINVFGEIKLRCGVCKLRLTRFRISKRCSVIKIEEPENYEEY